MPTCEICNFKKTKFFHKIDKYRYYDCSRCLTLILQPKPTVKETDSYYKKNFKYTAGKINENIIRARARLILKNLKKLNPEGKTLLDIGSGYGYFLDEAREFGFKILGIEPSKQLISVSLYQYNDTVLNTTFEQYFKQNPSKRFDFVTMIHTIEHVMAPKETIYKAVKLLKPEGILYIETPNLASHLFGAEKYKYTFLTPPDHIWIFSLKSFLVIIKDISTVKIEKFSTYSYPEHLMGIIKRIKFEILNSKSERTSDVQTISDDQKSNDRNVFLNLKRSKLKFVSNFRNVKFIIINKLLAPFLTPLLNLGNKGSILELYIRKK